MTVPGPHTISVVASGPEQRARLQELLEGAGHAVVPFPDAEQALAALRVSPPALIVAGLSTPQLEGWTLCRLLHAPEQADLSAVPPVLIVSPEITGEAAARITADLGGAGLLPYPITAERLLSAVEPLLVRASATTPDTASRDFQATERRFYRAMKDAGAGYFFIDTQGCFRWVNDAWLRFHGYSALDEVVGRHFSFTQAEEDVERAAEIVRTLLSGTPVPTGEFSRKRKDGTVGYHIFSAHPVVDGGRVVGVEGFLIDTTAGREAEESYQMLFQQMLDGFALHEMIFDSDGRPADYRFLAANPAFERATGLQAPDILGRTVLQVLPGLERHWIENYGRVVLTGEPFRFESRHAGMGKDFEVVAYRPRPGQFACIFRDITPQKQHEEEISRLVYLNEVLSQVNQAIVRAPTREELFRTVCEVAQTHGHFLRSWIAMLGDTGLQLVATDKNGPDSPFPIRAAECGVGLDAVSAGRPVICNAILPGQSAADCHLKATQHGIGSCAAFPIRSHGQVCGVLCVHAADEGFFRDAEVKLLEEVAVDVSFALDKLEADEARRETEERFTAVFEHLPVPACISTLKEGIFLQVNRQFETLFGFSREELIGKSSLELGILRSEQRSQMAELFEKQGRLAGVERQMRARDGRILNCLSTLERIRQGGQDRILAVLLDITERKKADEALRESEERYRVTFQNIPAGVVVYEADGSVSLRNAEALKLSGSGEGDAGIALADRESSAFREDGSVCASEDLPVSKCIRTGERQTDTVLGVRRPDGSVFWAVYSATPVVDPGTGKVLRAVLAYRDITAHKQAEEALRESEGRFAAFMSNLPAAAFVKDESGRTVFANEYLQHLLSFQNWEGKTTPELVAGEVGQRMAADDREAMTNGPLKIEESMVDNHGVLRTFETIKFPIRVAGRQPLLGGVAIEITERIRAEEQLRFSQQRLSLHIRQTPLGIVEFDLEGRVTAWNPGACTIFGYSEAEAIGKHWTFIVPPTVSGSLQGVWEQLAAQGGSLQSTNANLTKDGRTIICEWFNTTLVDPAGRAIGIATTAMDITARLEAEQERERLQLELQQAHKMESIGRLAGGVAHDFNNLLTVINGYSLMLQQELQEGDPIADSLREIQKAGDRAAQLTRQLLAFSRKQIVEPKRLDLNALIRETRDMLRRLMGEDIEVAVQLAPDLWPILADPGSLHQVLMNLAVNARDAMPHGGRFTLETANVDADEDPIAGLRDGRRRRLVRFSVSDSGTGMSEQVRQHIFEPFFTTKSEGVGTGLGLSTVYGIVTQAGGAISVQSEPDRGTAFVIHFPAVEDSAAPDVQTAVSPAVALRGTETVLVVEDQAEVRKLAVMFLKRCGYRILEAASGGEALLAAERHAGPIHLMLTDVVMPGMNGKELSDRLRPLRTAMKVLYMSGYAADHITSRGLLEPGMPQIAKPFTPEALASKVREVLGPPARLATILVVDDEQGVREFLRKVLLRAGYEVLTAPDGRDVLKIARSQAVQLVITDLIMPDQEGIETIRTLHREAPGVGIIAMSGAFGGQFLKVAEMMGANAVLSKPVSPELLLARVAEVIAQLG
jgi:two-component system cell cycle sensor histidine kinase/response regulator CckA